MKNEPDELNEVGIGGMRRTYKENQIEIDFRTYGHPLCINDDEQFSEKTVMNFIVQSYASSCLTLLNQMKTYKESKTHKSMNDCAMLYFPAMFCFRHYIELKLKYLYMCYTDKPFKANTHDLSFLHGELVKAGFKHNVFKKPLQYIEDREFYMDIKDSDAFVFRYLIKQDFKCKEKLIIPMFEFDTIQTFITDIEHYTNILLVNEIINKK